MEPDVNFGHFDSLDSLNKNIPFKEKLVSAHQSIKEFFPFVARIAIALYDPKTSVLKTFVHSSGDEIPLSNYQTTLNNAPSLKEILDKRRPRIVNNMVTFEDGKHEHTVRLGRQGYAASYTMPMFHNGVFFGFIFFNSAEENVFKQELLNQFDVYGHLLSLMVINEMSAIDTLTAAVMTTGNITHMRDPETGSHLDRMSRYARLIATTLADKYKLDDDYIEHIFMFSPLHDIGKIGIPDSILLKESSLTDKETAIMHTHAQKGHEMIDDLLKNFNLKSFESASVLRNIALFHHEDINGKGYPEGRKGDSIPLEARIVAVADVFDALTSKRPYKEAWSNEEAFATLNKLAGEKLDNDCVKALIANEVEILKIQALFREDSYG